MRYGMNPHQAARVVENGRAPLTVVNGTPSLINYLDALNAWQLVHEASQALGDAVATSFKHVSPAGVAVAGCIDAAARETWGLAGEVGSMTSAYVRARDADPKSSFGDVIGVSGPVDLELADFLSRTVSDAIVAPGFESGAMAKLAAKKNGKFLVFEADPAFVPPAWESRDVYGMTFAQERDTAPLVAALAAHADSLPAEVRRDALLALATLRYTQSNSIVLAKGGVTLGIGAGQQNRVDCVRLAAAKARSWWLRKHPDVRGLSLVEGMGRTDRINWQIRYAEESMSSHQVEEFVCLFGIPPGFSHPQEEQWRDAWVQRLKDVTLASDGFLPFRDNIDFAAEVGVCTIVEPGGSIRSAEVREAARAFGMRHIETGLRLFHH